MRIFIALCFLLISAVNPAHANSAYECALDKMPFGSDIGKVMERYNLKAINIRNEGEFLIPERGIKICKDLPEQSLIQFIFIDNTLVQIRIDTDNKGGELKEYALKIFGGNDDSERKEAADKNSDMALWNKDNAQAVVYSAFNDGKGSKEMLEVTSKQYKRLFDKLIKQQETEK